MSDRDGTSPATILIDGPSGSGKSTLAAAVLAAWPRTGPAPQLLTVDALCRGWDGLLEASEILVDDVLAPRHAQRPAVWRRWDWIADELAEANAVDPVRPLIVEGCGALTRRSAPFADATVWVEAPFALRRARGLERDGNEFAPYWDRWDAQWQTLQHREHGRARAGTVITLDDTGRISRRRTRSD